MSIISKIIIWYYRIIGVTFGGVVIKNNQYEGNLLLKRYSLLIALLDAITGIICIFILINSREFNAIYDTGLPFVYCLMILTFSLVICQTLANEWFLQKNGLKIISIMAEYGLGKKNKLFIFLLWFLHFFANILVLIYDIISNPNTSQIGIILIIWSKLFLSPALDALFLIIWSLSLSITEYYLSLRKILGRDKRSPVISIVRKSFAETRKSITLLDKAVALPQIISTVSTMITLMVEVYIITVGSNYSALSVFKNLFMFNSLALIFKLIFNCIINGKVYEEADRLLSVLDDITIGKGNLDDVTFKEAMIFMSISRDLRNGFSIGGYLPLKKTTLLSIFSFILTYSVILIRTGAM